MQEVFLNGCKNGDIELVDGLNINYCDGWGLRRAVRYERKHVLSQLLSRPDLQMNLANKYGLTALHTAARFNVEAVVDDLLNHPKINPNLQTKKGCSPAMVAAKYCSTEVLKLLLRDKRVDLALLDTQGRCIEDLVAIVIPNTSTCMKDDIIKLIKDEKTNRINLRKKKLTLNTVVDPSKYLENQARDKVNRLLDDMYEVQREEMTRFMLTMEQASKQFEIVQEREMGEYFQALDTDKDTFISKQNQERHHFLAKLEMKRAMFLAMLKDSRKKFYKQEHNNLIKLKKKQDQERATLQLRQESRKMSSIQPASPCIVRRSNSLPQSQLQSQLCSIKPKMLSPAEVIANRQRRCSNLTMEYNTSNTEELVDRRRPASLSPTPAHKLVKASKDCYSAQPSRKGSPVPPTPPSTPNISPSFLHNHISQEQTSGQKSPQVGNIIDKPYHRSDQPTQQPYHRSDQSTQQPYHQSDQPTRQPYHRSDQPNQQPYQWSDQPTQQPYHQSDQPTQQPYHRSDQPTQQPYHQSDQPNQQPYHRSDQPTQPPYSNQPLCALTSSANISNNQTSVSSLGHSNNNHFSGMDEAPSAMAGMQAASMTSRSQAGRTRIEYHSVFHIETGQVHMLPIQVVDNWINTTTPSPLPSLELVQDAAVQLNVREETLVPEQREVKKKEDARIVGLVKPMQLADPEQPVPFPEEADQAGFQVTPQLARKHGMAMEVLKEEEEERYMSAEDSEILSITNSAIGSFTKSDSFRSLAGDDYRDEVLSPSQPERFPSIPDEYLTIREIMPTMLESPLSNTLFAPTEMRPSDQYAGPYRVEEKEGEAVNHARSLESLCSIA